MTHETGSTSRTRTQWIAWVVVLMVAYAGAAIGMMHLPVGGDIVSPFWPSAGIGVAGLVLLGRGAWPAIVLGEAAALVVTGVGPMTAIGLGAGNACGAAVAVTILRRLDFDHAIGRARDVLGIAVAAPLASAITSVNGVMLLGITNADPDRSIAALLAMWWLGDITGIVVTLPLLLSVVSSQRIWTRAITRARLLAALECLVVVAAMCAAAWIVFGEETWRRPALLLPFWLWLTYRFRALGAGLGVAVIAVFGTIGIIGGTFTVTGADSTETAQVVNAMLMLASISMLLFATAFSERDEANRRLQVALADERDVARELRRLDELKDRLLAAVSHELRTPLTSILALSTLLDDSGTRMTASKRAEMYEHIVREAQRLDALLSDLLDVERVRSGLLDPKLSDVDMSELVRQVVARHPSSDASIRLVVEPVRLRVDPMMIDRVVDNLVTNARHHTPRDTAITVRLESTDDGALIAVEDAGAGVLDEDKDSIFEPFNRGSATITDAPGTGIGLSLVLQFTQLHGGRVWVEDRPGGGASFRVFLPVRPEPAAR